MAGDERKNSAASPNVDIVFDGTPADDNHFQSYCVERDMYQPDMASIVLSNQDDIYTAKLKIGDPVEILG